MAKKKRHSGVSSKIGLSTLTDYDENGNIRLTMTYPVNGEPHYLCDFQIQFDVECICVYKICKRFFDAEHQRRWKKGLEAFSFDEFTINYCLEEADAKKEDARKEAEERHRRTRELRQQQKLEKLKQNRLLLIDCLRVLKCLGEILDAFAPYTEHRTDNNTIFTLKETLLNNIKMTSMREPFYVYFTESKHSYEKKDGMFLVDVYNYFKMRDVYDYICTLKVDEAVKIMTVVDKCQAFDNQRKAYIDKTLKMSGIDGFKILSKKKFVSDFKKEIRENV